MSRRLAPIIILAFVLTLAFAAGAWAADRINLGIIIVKQEKLAQDIRKQLADGAAFEDLAKKYSVGPAASRGGRLGNVPVKRLRPEYVEALKNLAPGVPSKVIPTEEGYTILSAFSGELKAEPKPAAKAEEKVEPAQAAPRTADEKYAAAKREISNGLDAMALGNFSKASARFNAALGLNKYDEGAEFLLSLARRASQGKVKKQAAQDFAKGFAWYLNADMEKAAKALGAAMAADKGLWEAKLFLAEVTAAKGKGEAALEMMKEISVDHPKAELPLISLGQMYLEIDKLDEAEKYFTKALEIRPDSPQALSQLGSMALVQGDLEKARKFLERAVQVQPFNVEAYNDLGLTYSRLGMAPDAERVYLKAVSISSNYPVSHVNLGVLYAKHGHMDEAINEFYKALEIDGGYAQAHFNLAAAFMAKKDWKKAKFHLELAKEAGITPPSDMLQIINKHIDTARQAG